VQKRLNRSICSLGRGLGWAEGSKSSIAFARWRQYVGATWRMRLNRPSPAAMRPYVRLLRPFVMAALCNRGPLYFCPVMSIFYLYLSIFFYSSPNLSGRRLDVYHTSTHGVALVRILECRSEMWCMRLAANAGPKKVAKNRHLGTIG